MLENFICSLDLRPQPESFTPKFEPRDAEKIVRYLVFCNEGDAKYQCTRIAAPPDDIQADFEYYKEKYEFVKILKEE